MADSRDNTHAHYLVQAKTFLFNGIVEEGQTFWIDPAWEPGPHLSPLNDLAVDAFKRYDEDRKARGFPTATLDPIEALPSFGDGLQVEEAPPAVENERVVEVAQAQLDRPGPGLGNGGVVPPSRQANPPVTGPKAFEEPAPEKMAETSPLVTPTKEQEEAEAPKPTVPPPSKSK